MTINQFKDKWAPVENPYLKDVFIRDLWSVIDKLGEDRFRQVAIEVLSDIEGAELKMYDRNIDGYVDGVIAFGLKGRSEETGNMLTYPKAIGQQGSDWLWLLKIIAQQSLKAS